jgi:hypothetical protein
MSEPPISSAKKDIWAGDALGSSSLSQSKTSSLRRLFAVAQTSSFFFGKRGEGSLEEGVSIGTAELGETMADDPWTAENEEAEDRSTKRESVVVLLRRLPVKAFVLVIFFDRV